MVKTIIISILTFILLLFSVSALNSGNVLYFDGFDDYVEVAHKGELTPAKDYSFEIWAYHWDWGSLGNLGLFSKDDGGAGGYSIRGSSNGFLDARVRVNTDGLSFLQSRKSMNELDPGWHHFVGTYDGTTVNLYVDGVLAESNSISSSVNTAYPYSRSLRFGWGPLVPQFFNGMIDEPRLYGKVLSASEVSSHYNNGQGQVGGADPDLIAGWHFDAATATTPDYSGNGHVGYLEGSPKLLPRNLDNGTLYPTGISNKTHESVIVSSFSLAPANSSVEYGTTASYGESVTGVPGKRANNIMITGLSPATIYHYRITTTLSNGTVLQSGDLTFTTLSSPPTNNVFYVSPSGSSQGNGNINDPWDLKTVFAHPSSVLPGAIIYLRGGTYDIPAVEGGFSSLLQGTERQPITLRSYPGEWAVIDGKNSNKETGNSPIIHVQGDYVHFRDFEIMNSNTDRVTSVTGSIGGRGISMQVQAAGVKQINMIIRDTGQGLTAQNQHSPGFEAYGNLIYNNGWDAMDRGHGHSYYIQNPSGSKTFKENIAFQPFGINFRTGGSSNPLAAARNMLFEGNVFLGDQSAHTGPTIENLTFRENHFYQTKPGLNYGQYYDSVYLYNNVLMQGVRFSNYSKGIEVKHNIIGAAPPERAEKNVIIWTRPGWQASNYVFSNNTYYMAHKDWPYWSFSSRFYAVDNSYVNTLYAFNDDFPTQVAGINYFGDNQWQRDLGYDLDSTFSESDPTGTWIYVRPNEYDEDRSHIIIYNWDLSNQVTLTSTQLAGVLNSGDSYRLHNAFDYHDDTETGTFNGNLVISMTGRDVVKPVGYNQNTFYDDPTIDSPYPQFGVFVLKRTAHGSGSNPPPPPPPVVLQGDVNRDGRVDIADILVVVGRITSNASYDSAYDLNSDGSEDIRDLVLIVRYMN